MGSCALVKKCLKMNSIHYALACAFQSFINTLPEACGSVQQPQQKVSTCNKALPCSPESLPRLVAGACACAACSIFRSWLFANPLSMPAKIKGSPVINGHMSD